MVMSGEARRPGNLLESASPILLGGVVIVTLALYLRSVPASPKTAPDLVAMHLPSLTLTSPDGTSADVATWKGTTTLVNFWATWCDSCRAEMPDLVELQARQGSAIRIVGIATETTDRALVDRFLRAFSLNYPIYFSTPEFEKAFPPIEALPTSYLISRDGSRIRKFVGRVKVAELEQAIAALVDR
jgi:cytochrome c biogenesis protein CcmG/thiol:disulfide interchange protein DsbE